MSDATIAGKTNAASPSQTSTTIDTLPNELLLATLGLLSVMERAKVRTVSKRWNNIVMDLGIHLEPLFVDDQLGVPFYSSEIKIELNLWAFWFDFPGQEKLAAELQVPFESLTEVRYWSLMHYVRSEFLTDPPISTLAFQVTGPPGTPRRAQIQPIHAVLRSAKGSGGIRLGDFLDMCEKMRAYDTRLSLVGWGFVAWFAREGDGVNYDYVCERASTRNGIEVRKCTRKSD